MLNGTTYHGDQKDKLTLVLSVFASLNILTLAGGCEGVEDFEDGEALAYEESEDSTRGDLAGAEQSIDISAEHSDELPTDVTSEQQTEGTCLECSPSYFAACAFGSVTWQQQCSWNGCVPFINYGGGCGLCHCGSSCQQTPNTGEISASPTNVFIEYGLGCTEIEWDVDCGDSQVWVSHNGAPETLFAQGGSGTQDACWIQLGHSYTFRLYEGLNRSTLLDSVQVTGAQAPNVCDSCPIGTSCHCFDNVCRPNNQICP